MYKELLHIYGPLSIQSFGVLIAIGIILFAILAIRHPWRKQIASTDQFINILCVATIIGIIGGRLLYVISDWATIDHWSEIFFIWEGGFSLLGSIISIAILLPLYLMHLGIPVLRFFDLLAIHAPLLQAIARLGCFLAGCCYGTPTTVPWGIIYTRPDAFAPYCIALHPTQLYSAASLFGIFLLLYFVLQRYFIKPGQATCAYLMLVSAERFIIDFFRGDREFVTALSSRFSLHQYLSLGIFILASVFLVLINIKSPRE